MEVPLTTWDQIAPRAYIRQVYCFELAQAPSIGALQQTLGHAINSACAEYPDFAARVILATSPPGQLRLVHDAENHARLIVGEDTSVKYTYAELKRQGFPAVAFVGPAFHLEHALEPGGQGIPVVQVHARLIRGGLLLCIYVHHSTTDGIGMNKFVNSLSKYTNKTYPPPESNKPSARNELQPPEPTYTPVFVKRTHADLIDECPEYFSIPNNTGPLAFRSNPSATPIDLIPKHGRIFVFNSATINRLKSLAESSICVPSTFACLAALTWTHATFARIRAQPRFQDAQSTCSLVLPASWSRRAFPFFNDTNSVTNAVSMTKVYTTQVKLSRVVMLYKRSYKIASTKSAYRALVSSIMLHLDAIDEEYIAKRTRMIRSAPDPRSIGVNIDPQNPQHFIMNSWRHLGADTQWCIPGSEKEVTYPDAVRRVQNEWNMSAALILPGRKESSSYEVLVNLDAKSMQELCADKRWMDWADGTVE